MRLVRRVWLLGVMLTLACGVAAFGAVYQWALLPLAVASAFLGGAGLWLGRPGTLAHRRLLIALAILAVAIAVQLIPVSRQFRQTISPNADKILEQRDLTYSHTRESQRPLTVEPRSTRMGLGLYIAFSILLVGCSHALTRNDASRMAGLFTMMGATLAVVGVIQEATFNGKIYGFWPLVQGGNPFGPFINKNHFAGWMLLGIPVGLGYCFSKLTRALRAEGSNFRSKVLWLTNEDANKALLAAFGVLLMTLALVLTLSRSGITAALIAMSILLGSILASQPQALRRIAGVVYIAFLLSTVMLWVGPERIFHRFTNIDYDNISQRPAIWADTINIAKDFWVTGTGLNTFGVVTPFYQTSVPGEHLREAHNDYLQLWAEGGMLLTIPAVATMLIFALSIRSRLRQDVGSIWWVRMGAIAGLVAVAAQALVEFSLQIPANAASFAVVAGIALHDSRQ